MAGTSPDRSKRYESSTGSTSGNEAAVPKPGPVPDPRMAMTRDPAPKPDQATAVFSRRALLEAAEAEGLNLDDDEAATANPTAPKPGRRAGAGAAGADAAAGGSGNSSAADEGERGAGGGAGGAEARDEDGTAAAAEAHGGATDAGERADDEPGAESGAAPGDGGAAGGPGAESGAGEGIEGSGAESGDGEAVAGSEAEAGEADVDAEAEADAAEEPAAGAEPESDSESDSESGPAGVSVADPARAGDASSADEREADAPVAEREADTPEVGEPRADAPAGDTPKAAKPEIAAQADTAPTDEALAAHDPEADAPVDDERAGGAPADDASTVAELEVDGPEADVSAADALAGADSAADEREADEREADESRAGAPADASAAAEPGVGGSGVGGSEADASEADASEAESDAASKPAEPEDGAPAGAAPTAGAPQADGPQADDSGVDAPAGRGPEAADGGDAPRGPSADGDEGRTGDADGDSGGGDGGAGAGRPVDQATAVFRAPRVPEVDHPTTMLKLGGDTTGDDKDTTPPPAERTSKFVALKPLDEPPAPGGSAERTRAIPQVGPELTAQQPLPPKPPLDLLAELTNTPPPPQTPVRTIIRRVKIWTPLAILLAIVFAIAQAVRPLPAPALALTAEESYAFEGDKVSLPWPAEGQGWMDVNGIGTVDSFGEQKPVAIGSVAKAMTAYVILKEHPMKAGEKGETIPVDAKAETEGGYDKDGESTLNTVKEGDKLTQYDAIAAIMIPSANNIARLLARWDSNGSEEEFVKKMNAAAKELGMKNTTYTDPSGLEETTVSTAEDQVKLGNALVKMKALTDITRLPEWTDPSGMKHRNFNTLVPYDNAIGIKTGSTTAAGGNLLFAATKEVGGETAIVVGAILGQHTPPIIDTVNAVSRTAMVAAQDALTSDKILKKGDVVGYVDDQLGGRTPVVATKDVSAVGWAGKTVRLELNASTSIPHEAKAGTEVGSLIVGDGTGDGVEVPVALQTDLAEPGLGAKLTRVS